MDGYKQHRNPGIQIFLVAWETSYREYVSFFVLDVVKGLL